VKSFNLLKGAGVPHRSPRSFRGNAEIVTLVTGTDGTADIVEITVP
jgi:hypothetical protein